MQTHRDLNAFTSNVSQSIYKKPSFSCGCIILFWLPFETNILYTIMITWISMSSFHCLMGCCVCNFELKLLSVYVSGRIPSYTTWLRWMKTVMQPYLHQISSFEKQLILSLCEVISFWISSNIVKVQICFGWNVWKVYMIIIFHPPILCWINDELLSFFTIHHF